MPGCPLGFTPIKGVVSTTTVCFGPPHPEAFRDIDASHRILSVPECNGCPKPGQVGAHILGPVFAPPNVARTCACNAIVAANVRHLAARHDPTPAALQQMYNIVEQIRPTLFEAYATNRAEWPWTRWIERWPKWKADAVRDSFHSLQSDPTRVKAMVKREVLVGLTKDLDYKQMTKARLIHFYAHLNDQERHANEYFAFQKAVCDVFDGDKTYGDDIRITVSSAMNQSAKGRWFADALDWAGPNVHIIERDGAGWDSSMGKDHMDLQLSVMEGLGGDFLGFVNSTRRCKVSFSHTAAKARTLDFLEKFKYIMDHTTKSGHNDTSSRNSFINALITIAALRMIGITAARVIVIGDDMLCILKGPVDEDALIQAEYDCGIKPVAAMFGPEDISKVTFASDAFAPCAGGGYIAIPMLGKLLAKLYSTTTLVGVKDRAVFAHSIAVGLSALLLKAPLYGALLETCLHSPDSRVIKTNRWERRVDAAVEYDNEFRVWLLDRYGITNAQVCDLDNFLRTLSGPGYARHPVADVIMKVDLADPADRLPL